MQIISFFLDKTFFISDILDEKNCLLGRHVGKKEEMGPRLYFGLFYPFFIFLRIFFIICKKM